MDKINKQSETYQNLEDIYRQEDPWHFASNVYEKIRHRAMLELALLNDPNNVLDLGCGEGHFLKLLLTTKPDLKAVGVELIEEAAARARKRLQSLQATIVTRDLVQFLKSDNLSQGPYDLIILGEVLYFGVEEEQIDFVVKAVVEMLSPKGTVLLSHFNPDFTGWILERFENSYFIKEKEIELKAHNFGTWIISLESKKTK